MIRYVIDASVAIKWLVPENPEEQDVPQALALLDTLRNGGIALYQPNRRVTGRCPNSPYPSESENLSRNGITGYFAP